MLFDQIGTLLQEYRERYNVSQEELAFDLCAVSTLSHIENGEEMPGQELIDQLFSRLGLEAPALSAWQEKKVFDRAFIEQKIAEKEATGCYGTQELLTDYAQLGSMTPLETQYYHFHRAKDMLHGTKQTESALAELKTALDCTLHNYSFSAMPTQRLFSRTEFAILCEITALLEILRQKEDAFRLASYLAAYIDRGIISEYDAGEYAPKLFLCFSNLLLEKRNAETAVFAAQKGIDACVRYGELFTLPHLLHAKGNALSALEKHAQAQKTLSSAETIFATLINVT